MAGLGSLVVELSANIANFTSAMSKANYVAQQNTRAIVKEVHGMRASFDSIPGSIARIAAAAGGVYAIGYAFKAGIKAADEFKMEVIGIAAGITNIAKPGQGDIGQVFQRSAAFAKEMNKELMRVAAYSPAEPAEMMKGYNQLVQQGYVARLDEADALGVIITRIKLATAGQDSNKQINQEIRAVLQGQAKDTSMVAMELQNRLGPGWKDIVESHKQSGDLLQWWASLYPGITAASNEYQGTLEAQKTSLIGNLKYLSYEGMGGAYDYIVGKAQELNTYIQENSKEIAGNMKAAWDGIRGTIEVISVVLGGVATVISEIVGWIRTGWGYLEGWRGSLSAIANQRADMGVGMGLDVMPAVEGGFGQNSGLDAIGNQEAIIAQTKRNNDKMAKAVADWKKETYGLYLKDLGPPATMKMPGAGKEGKGGGGAQASADRMQSIIDNLNKEIAKLSQGSMAEIDAWAKKTIDDIEKVGRKGAETQEALALVAKVTSLKKQKIEEDFTVFVGKESGNAYVEIEAQAKQWLTKYKGIKQAEEEINNITARKKYEVDRKNAVDTDNMLKSYLEGMSAITVDLKEQWAWKKKILDLEIKMSHQALEDSIKKKGKGISPEMADDQRKLLALTNQAKKFKYEWDSVQSTTQEFSSALGSVAHGFMSMIQGVATGATAVSQGVVSLLQTVQDAIFSLILNMVMKWAEGQMMMMMMNEATLASKTASSTAAVAIDAAETTGKVANAGVVAGAKAYSAYAGIPWIGLALGAAAAAIVMGAIFALKGSIKSSAGGDWQVATNGLRMVHADETIIPAGPAAGLRKLIGEGGSGGMRPNENGGGSVVYSPTYHINAIDARGVEAVLQEHGRTITKVINREVGRRGRRL